MHLNSTDPGEKGYVRGTHRLCSPAETVARVSPYLRVMGITRVANVTGLDTVGIPVVMVSRPNSRGVAVSQGKGLDLDAAKASGLMEAIEAYHAEHITLPLKLASYEELRYTHTVVDVERLPRLAGSVLDPNLPMLWIEGHDLLADESVWVPFETVHTNYTTAQRPTHPLFRRSSNGLAGGNHPLEAISHAICEVVERDARTLWSLHSPTELDASRIDLARVLAPACRDALDCFDRAGLDVHVWDMTTDIDIPAFCCTIVERTRDPFRPLFAATGSGCHLDPAVALLRAMTEAAQSRLTIISGARDDIYPDQLAAMQRSPAEDGGSPSRAFGEAPAARDTFLDDLRLELAHLRAAGCDRVIVVDLTKPELGIPVARVIVPGLEASGAHPPLRYGDRAQQLLRRRA